jgi:hypothetical protein
MLCVGSPAGEEVLAGCHAMDRHFATAPLAARRAPTTLVRAQQGVAPQSENDYGAVAES